MKFIIIILLCVTISLILLYVFRTKSKSSSEVIVQSAAGDVEDTGKKQLILSTNNGNLFSKPLSGVTAVKGMIIMWSQNNIPEGWALCDGNNDTPNLTDRFVVGVHKEAPNNIKKDQLLSLNDNGGSNDYKISSDTHNHEYLDTVWVENPNRQSHVNSTLLHKVPGFDSSNFLGREGGQDHDNSFIARNSLTFTDRHWFEEKSDNIDLRPSPYKLRFIIKI